MTPDRSELIIKTVINDADYVTKGQYTIWDTQIPGFGLRVGARTKTFTLRRDFRRHDGQRVCVRRALGLAACNSKRGQPTITVADARRAAYSLIAQLDAGHDPLEDRQREAVEAEQQEREQRGMTLAEACEMFQASKGRGGRVRSASTQNLYDRYQRIGYLSAWMPRPLKDITRREAYQRHRELTREIAAGRYQGPTKKGYNIPERQSGKQTADGVFRWFRAVWNRAMRADETLPICPTINVERHNVKAERSAIPTAKLAAWRAGVQKVENPIRRDYLLFALFSGMRRQSIATMRWEHVDFERRVLHVPNPKGGEERAFYLPLSNYLLDLLRGRQRENPELVKMQVIPDDTQEWVWPAYAGTGHIREPREKINGMDHFTIHDLRRTFITVAESLDIPLHVVGVLVNHRQPGGSMTAQYVAHEVERLRAPMQLITDQLLMLTTGPRPANVVPMRRSR